MAKLRHDIEGTQESPQAYSWPFLHLEFRRLLQTGDPKPVVIEPNALRKLSISMNFEQMVPTFTMQLQDTGGMLTHLAPSDRRMGRLLVRLGRPSGKGIETSTDWLFDIWRKKPLSTRVYEIHGALALDNYYTPEKVRSFRGPLSSTLATIAAEIGVTETDFGNGLEEVATVLQPAWTNAQLLKYLTTVLAGEHNESAYHCMIHPKELGIRMLFKSLPEMVKANVKYRFTLTSSPMYDAAAERIYFPILHYEIFDDYRTLGLLGSRKQFYSYFDWNRGQYRTDNLLVQGNQTQSLDFLSLTDHHLIDREDDPNNTLMMRDLGRTTDFDSDFRGRALNQFHKSLLLLSKMRISTWGFDNLYPGDIIEIRFPEDMVPRTMEAATYYGYWFVREVNHCIGNGFYTFLVLTRNGITTGRDSQLLQAQRRRM